MPELPEVEVLVRHLRKTLPGRIIRRVVIHRTRIVRPTNPKLLRTKLLGSRFIDVQRRGKYLLFHLQPRKRSLAPFRLLGHLGMTGRIYLRPPASQRPKHAAVELLLDSAWLTFEDTRYFGRLTLDAAALNQLGPEPLGLEFTPAALHSALQHSRQPVKVKLLDQATACGLGNIYASEALFHARLSPRIPAHRLTLAQTRKLHRAIRTILSKAIAWGSTVPLLWSGNLRGNDHFYYGTAASDPQPEEQLRVYNRTGQPCPRCATPIRQIRQASRSTFFCPRCQPG